MCIRDRDNTESMVFDPQEIMDHGGLFGGDHEEWEKSPQFHEKVMERQEHQPVSYTHLDVYKRQHLELVITLSDYF